MKKLKAKSINLSIPRIDSAEDGPEVEIIQREILNRWRWLTDVKK